jgi:hypothetical protein
MENQKPKIKKRAVGKSVSSPELADLFRSHERQAGRQTYTHTERESLCRTRYTVAFCTCTPIFDILKKKKKKGGAK